MLDKHGRHQAALILLIPDSATDVGLGYGVLAPPLQQKDLRTTEAGTSDNWHFYEQSMMAARPEAIWSNQAIPSADHVTMEEQLIRDFIALGSRLTPPRLSWLANRL